MLHTRLSLALRDGAVSLPQDGRLLVIGPNTQHDVSALPKDRVTIYNRFFPDHAHWTSRGFDTVHTLPDGGFDAALVCAPRSKLLAQAWVAAATKATDGGLILLDGQKTDGIDSLLKAIRQKANLLGALSKAHGKLVWFDTADVGDWTATDTQLEGGFTTCPGVFSADGIDKGSAVLAAAMPDDITGRVADLGAGWGYLARHILQRPGVTSLDLIEADLVALDCAKLNLDDPRANFIWGDATQFCPPQPYDVVISNPPFHTGRAGDPELGRAFIRAAAAMLAPSGRFVMVANRHLPYEDTLGEQFNTVEDLGGTPGFKLLSGVKPRRTRR
ncbi:16S rRNA (guanine1207-N2)-methyltransferase [Aliiroseovarius sediminilitoris]|uniref:16S rRNA (Guanine1207-N2)-methyltransferase n=1 Tax=Aliiroseovarius sediminilitoris TaxID=1173584 RepID=A0A1I0QUE5_9RHOB|nr:class I SAM-dependent methyltransferase [Aliiroseovarius sediminilitoris]SEW31033.1 16S rRNA (guanine1207-N2)-methyltransferase [Aliiroseovarius sediminilitoris]